ncbi:putative short-chain dehydrogenases/reductase [Setomelanomma holmii]|uniref:Short-chain dehydrogenases/reductase n=1 Tax=Setomelanomma holmii TaxID=210430 RepID=A0A9P4HBJ6_9PLEO|nr:putative short-chain dehydrogenases/reductase [Setomelanomma holmii]
MQAPQNDRIALITGCSAGSLGEALAFTLHERGIRVIAAARNAAKMEVLKARGIECVLMDVLDNSSIEACVKEVTRKTNRHLDILINSVGGGHYMPFLDLNISDARKLFEINVFSYLDVTQAFMPLLMHNKSILPGAPKGLLVNQTSISSVLRTPFHSAYSASKAAMAMFSDTQRIELEPFGVRVIDLKTGSVESNFGPNRTNTPHIPENSLYKPIKEKVEKVIQGTVTESYAEDRMVWANSVADDLLQDSPPQQIWRGGKAGTIYYADRTVLASGIGDGEFQKLGGLDELKETMKERVGKERK